MTLHVVLLSALLFAGIAMTVNEGLWNNTVNLFLVILAGLMAIAAGLPFGSYLMVQLDQDDSFAWYFAFAGMWLTFTLAMVVFKILAEKASKIRVKFLQPLDKFGGPLMGVFVAVMLTSFAAFTLIQAPYKAGAWDLSQASDGQKSAISYAHAPFFNIAQAFIQAEAIETPLLK